MFKLVKMKPIRYPGSAGIRGGFRIGKSKIQFFLVDLSLFRDDSDWRTVLVRRQFQNI